MFNPSRPDVRQFYFETWRKYQQKIPLTGAELTALAIIQEHPEYHELLTQTERYRQRDFPPELGAANPFLHLSMHLALQEQLAIDQPQGVRQYYQRLLSLYGAADAAQHEMMDCLGEMIWQAQRRQTAFDHEIYFSCMDKKLSDE